MSGGDPQARAMRALAGAAGCAGVALEMLRAQTRPWASATFSGHRHALLLAASDDAATAALLDRLPELELAMPGQIVADLAVGEISRTGGRTRFALEMLTLETG